MSPAPGGRPPRVCIVSHQAYGAMAGGRSGHAGGVEHQTSMLARWLAGHGFGVSILVWNEGQPAATTIDGVHVVAMCPRDAGVPGLRFLHPRWTSLVQAMRHADADAYYHNCAEYVTGQVALWCRRHDRRFVYSVASDPECDPRLPALRHRRERILFRFGLRHADRVIVQTARQQEMLRSGWGLDGEVLPMPCTAPPAGFEPAPPERPARVVWIGRISREKRLDRLIEIARQLPDVVFDVAGEPDRSDPRMHDLVGTARQIPNIRVLGRVARDRMAAVYDGATCLVCTSEYEGFPNTFLEAWSRGVPVVSTVDPDSLIAMRGLGLTGNPAAIGAQIRRLADDATIRNDAGLRARQYFDAHHHDAVALARFERVFREVLRLS